MKTSQPPNYSHDDLVLEDYNPHPSAPPLPTTGAPIPTSQTADHCRICFFTGGNLIKPCNCVGKVHRECLNVKRSDVDCLDAFWQCTECHTAYTFVACDINRMDDCKRDLKYRGLVCRDISVFVLVTQVAIWLCTAFTWGCDQAASYCVPSCQPSSVKNVTMNNNSSMPCIKCPPVEAYFTNVLGAYYFIGLLIFLCLVGMFAVCASICGCLPKLAPAPVNRYDPRRARESYKSFTVRRGRIDDDEDCFCCYACYVCCDICCTPSYRYGYGYGYYGGYYSDPPACDCLYLCLSCSENRGGSYRDRNTCGQCNDSGSCNGTDTNDAGPEILAVIVIVALIFACIGFIYGLMLSVGLLSRSMGRNWNRIRLENMAYDFVVADLGAVAVV